MENISLLFAFAFVVIAFRTFISLYLIHYLATWLSTKLFKLKPELNKQTFNIKNHQLYYIILWLLIYPVICGLFQRMYFEIDIIRKSTEIFEFGGRSDSYLPILTIWCIDFSSDTMKLKKFSVLFFRVLRFVALFPILNLLNTSILSVFTETDNPLNTISFINNLILPIILGVLTLAFLKQSKTEESKEE
jgi:hypothetical protein